VITGELTIIGERAEATVIERSGAVRIRLFLAICVYEIL
jgi:hypothetical protein